MLARFGATSMSPWSELSERFSITTTKTWEKTGIPLFVRHTGRPFAVPQLVPSGQLPQGLPPPAPLLDDAAALPVADGALPPDPVAPPPLPPAPAFALADTGECAPESASPELPQPPRVRGKTLTAKPSEEAMRRREMITVGA
jgi:hypothetical protein